ncbi:hypothetical protein CARUB_v10024586mg [Capsella rubella]|uniref:Uncharacterized protein n=1 Tax=Capsella rubella TaxID=81985 RepID=R0FZV3_9BRAS|nr:hypothetical protein CARUB_v10024586mg [Capsella rubella]
MDNFKCLGSVLDSSQDKFLNMKLDCWWCMAEKLCPVLLIQMPRLSFRLF